MTQLKKKIFFVSIIFLSFFNFAFAVSTELNTKLKVVSEASSTPTYYQSDNGGIPSLVGINQLRIIDFKIDANTISSNFKVELSNPAKLLVYIGETPNLELGNVYSGGLSNNHSFLLSDLGPNKQYFYKIEVFDNTVNKISTGIKSFFTSGLSTGTYEQKNVSDIEIKNLNKGFLLSWRDVDIDEGSYFRILKSYKFYPVDPYDGIPIYEGKDMNFIDNDLINNTKYYYTIFTCSPNGLCSSGTSVSSFFGEEDKIIDYETSASTTISSLKSWLIKDVFLFENEKHVTPENEIYLISKGGPINLRVKIQDKILEQIKGVSVEIYLNNNKIISHLAKYNKEEDYFDTSRFFLINNGIYKVKINIFDLNKNIISQKTIFLNYLLQKKISNNIGCFLNLKSFIYCYWWIIVLAIIGTFMFIFFIKK